MSNTQRLTFLGIAAAIALVAVVVVLTTGGDDSEPASTTATPTATAAPSPSGTEEGTATPEETATPTPEPTPEVTVFEPGEEGRLEVKQGDTVRLKVRSDKTDHVHIHGYDLLKDIKAGGEVSFAFEAKITGIFEVELEESTTRLGEIVVEPK